MKRKHATIKEIVEFGLDNIPTERTIAVNLQDFIYVRRTLEEYMRFFHQPLHYPTLENVEEFLGDKSSAGRFEVLSTAIYKKLYNMGLPEDIERLIMDSDTFEHPLFPEYYEPKQEYTKNLLLTVITQNQNQKRKAEKVADSIRKELGEQWQILNIDIYDKFDNSYKIEFKITFIDKNSDTTNGILLTAADKLASPWMVYSHQENIELIYNKADSSRIRKPEFNVIAWGYLQITV